MKGLGRILVVDLSKLLPGPFCTMTLADLGCRVVRVELPHWPDGAREAEPRIQGQGYAYWMLNRNKESLCLDFRKPEGLRALHRLLAKADVLVEGFRPGMMEKLGLGWAGLRRRYPRLVCCSISGYGKGPWARRAGHDLNFQASCGLLALGDSSGEVTFPPVQLADLSAAHHAASAILAALLDRAATGKGRRLSVSMAEAAFAWPVFAVGEWLATGRSPRPRGAWWNGGNPLYRLYRTQDGRHLAVAILERPFAVDLLRRLGREDLLPGLSSEEAGAGEALARELEAVFSRRTLADWTTLLSGNDVCVSPVLTFEEALREPHVKGLGLLQGPGGACVRPPVSSPGGDLRVRRPPPALGADNRRVLRSAGLTAAEISGLERAGLLKTVSRVRRQMRLPRQPKA
ncbi:MAG: CoA transferase [Elusimicrobia bacterium]|nr:CoA transferase [Elusimicrobiota bacterium]